MTKVELELEVEGLRARLAELEPGARLKWHIEQREGMVKALKEKEIRADVAKAMLAVLESLRVIDGELVKVKDTPVKAGRKAPVNVGDLANLVAFGK